MNICCVKCKGRGFCGRSSCPHIMRSEAMFKVKPILEQDFQGESPAPFIGHYGYPYLNVGILSPFGEKDTWEYDAPRYWAESNYEIPKIVDFRSSLVNSRFKAHAQDTGKLIDISQEVAMASNPADVEISLIDKPKFRLNNDSIAAPMGPNAELKKLNLTSNPNIHTKVEKTFSDSDLKSKDGLIYLYENDFDENFLTKVLSVGSLGLKYNRKLVPTRWSITATDDTLSKHVIEKIKSNPQSDYLAFFGGYLGNYYLILMIPDVWSYELFEAYMPKASFNQSEKVEFVTDHENFSGRKNYANNTAGGYYAARLSIAEKLESMKRQSSVIALRFITGEYSCPLGVWVVREAARKALAEKPLEFASKELLLKYAASLVKKKFGYDIDNILKQSIILKNIKEQRKLFDFV